MSTHRPSTAKPTTSRPVRTQSCMTAGPQHCPQAPEGRAEAASGPRLRALRPQVRSHLGTRMWPRVQGQPANQGSSTLAGGAVGRGEPSSSPAMRPLSHSRKRRNVSQRSAAPGPVDCCFDGGADAAPSGLLTTLSSHHHYAGGADR